MKVEARSASDRTDDWPFWMVWDGSVNVTIKVIERLTGLRVVGMPFVTKETALDLATRWNTDHA